MCQETQRHANANDYVISEPVDHPEPGGANEARSTAATYAAAATSSAAPDDPTPEPDDAVASAAESCAE